MNTLVPDLVTEADPPPSWVAELGAWEPDPQWRVEPQAGLELGPEREAEPEFQPRSEPEPAGFLARFTHRIWRFGRAIVLGVEWIFGVGSLIVGLSILAALPLAQFLSLGYLLESSARVARSGRLRDGFIGVRRAARVGGLALGVMVSLLPLWLVRSMADSAAIIDPDGLIAANWRIALVVLAELTLLHLLLACLRGGRMRHFLWPLANPFWLMGRLRRGGLYAQSRDAFWSYLGSFHLGRYFRLGLISFLGTLAWLAPPAILIGLGGMYPLLGIIGAIALAVIVPFLPFLQVHYAVEGHARALFDRKAARQRFRRAPWAFALALLALLFAAIPLYLLKIEMIPREAAWLPSLVFVIFLAPARLLTGWAYARSARRDQPRHWLFRLVGRLAIAPAAVLYVGVVFAAQYTSWGGALSLYEQHAFLLPVPFLSM